MFCKRQQTKPTQGISNKFEAIKEICINDVNCNVINMVMYWNKSM